MGVITESPPKSARLIELENNNEYLLETYNDLLAKMIAKMTSITQDGYKIKQDPLACGCLWSLAYQMETRSWSTEMSATGSPSTTIRSAR
jgi:hypothetical protein